MEITIGVWVIPVLLTVCLWVWIIAVINRESGGGGMYSGIGDAVTAAVFGALGLAGTFFIWMVYFAIMYFFGG